MCHRLKLNGERGRDKREEGRRTGREGGETREKNKGCQSFINML